MSPVGLASLAALNGSGNAQERIDALAEALEQGGYDVSRKADGNGHRSQCPGHGERMSLSLWVDENGWPRVKCHADCTPEQALAPIEWKPDDLLTSAQKRGASNGQRARFKPKPPEPMGEAMEQLVAGWHEHLIGSTAELKALEAERGITPDVVRLARLGLDGSEIVIPHYRDNQLVGIENWIPRHLRGNGPGLRVPPGQKRWLYEPEPERTDELVIICEGSTDALAMRSQTGLRVVATPSAGTWPSEYAQQLHASGVREAVVMYDADDTGRKGSDKAVRSLRTAGIDAQPLDPDPNRTDGFDVTALLTRKRGSDGELLIESNGKALIARIERTIAQEPRATVHAAASFSAPRPGDEELRAAAFDGGKFIPRQLALGLTAEAPVAKAEVQLYVYKDGVYRPGEKLLASRAAEILGDKWRRNHLAELLGFLHSTSPALDERPPLDRINVANGIIDLATGQLEPHTPDLLSPVQIAAAYDPEASCPRIERFLAETIGAEMAVAFFEMTGYVATPDNRQQKAFMLEGPGGNGKSTALELLRAFLGHANVSTVALHQLEDDRFATADLYGKLANIVADLPARAPSDSSVFKAIVGGDALRAERKHRDAFSFMPYTRLLFSPTSRRRRPTAVRRSSTAGTSTRSISGSAGRPRRTTTCSRS